MRLFHAQPDDDTFQGRYLIDAAHKWGLPGVACPRCGFTGGAVGLAYPNLALPTGLDPRPYENGWPVSPERIRELAKPIEALAPPPLPFAAGTEFGQLCGLASGRFGDFTWVNPWTPLASPEALESLAKKGVSDLKAIPTAIEMRSGKGRFRHLEICLYPTVHACSVRAGARCPGCGMPLARQPNAIEPWSPVLLSESWPDNVSLTRIFEAPAFVVASEAMMHAAEDLHLTDIRFAELDLRGEDRT